MDQLNKTLKEKEVLFAAEIAKQSKLEARADDAERRDEIAEQRVESIIEETSFQRLKLEEKLKAKEQSFRVLQRQNETYELLELIGQTNPKLKRHQHRRQIRKTEVFLEIF